MEEGVEWGLVLRGMEWGAWMGEEGDEWGTGGWHEGGEIEWGAWRGDEGVKWGLR